MTTKKLKKMLAKNLAKLQKAEEISKKLIDDRNKIIKKLSNDGMAVKEIAELVGMTRQMVYKIIN